MSKWKIESGDACAQEADKQGLVRYGKAGVAILTWTSKEKSPSAIGISGSVTCPSCQTPAAFEIDCDTDCDLLSGPKVTCRKCSGRVDFSVWTRLSDGARRLFVTGTVFSRAPGSGSALPIVTIANVKEPAAKQTQDSTPATLMPETLHWASDICEDKEKLRQALASGIDINARDEVGATALHQMATLGSVDAVRCLLEAGADPKIRLNSGRTTTDILSHNIQHEAAHRREQSEQILQLLRNPPRSGCFLATACYGSYDHPVVQEFRWFRDSTLNETIWGRHFIDAYYRISPLIVPFLHRHPFLAVGIRRCLLSPFHHFVTRLHRRRLK